MLGKVLWQQADEADEVVLDALGHGAVGDGSGLCVVEVEEENGIEHAQDLVLVHVVRVEVAGDLAHLLFQPEGVGMGEGELGHVELDDGDVGDVDEVVGGGGVEGDTFVGQQADAAVVVGGGDDGDGQPGGVDVEVVGVESELLAVVDDGEPAVGDQREGVGCHVAVGLVGAEGDGGIRLVAIHLAVPLGYGLHAVHLEPGFS